MNAQRVVHKEQVGLLLVIEARVQEDGWWYLLRPLEDNLSDDHAVPSYWAPESDLAPLARVA